MKKFMHREMLEVQHLSAMALIKSSRMMLHHMFTNLQL